MLGVLGDGGAHRRHVRKRVEKVRTFLEENLTRDIDIPGVARANSLSPFYLHVPPAHGDESLPVPAHRRLGAGCWKVRAEDRSTPRATSA